MLCFVILEVHVEAEVMKNKDTLLDELYSHAAVSVGLHASTLCHHESEVWSMF